MASTAPRTSQDRDPPSARRRWTVRDWSVRNARMLETVYNGFARTLEGLAPIARAVPPKTLEAAFAATESRVKGVLFDCRMCGQCSLSATGLSCAMNCPKGLRNGPCGGVREAGFCEVQPDMKCVWLDAWSGAQSMRGGDAIETALAPLDHRRVGRSSWMQVIEGDAQAKTLASHRSAPKAPAQPAARAVEPPPAPGPLERSMRAGRFCVTAEFNPPDTADPEAIYARAKPLIEVCDSVNVTDGAGANTHISSIAVCALLARQGYDPVMQVSCRDRNRIAIQGDVLGAAALGIRNVLCLTGDGIGGGNQPEAKPVFDLDCTSLLATLSTLRDESRFMSGTAIERAPALFLGATANPFAVPAEVEVPRLAKKIEAGARFFQTQFCFDIETFRAFFARFRDRGLHERCHFTVGVGPLASGRAARWMRSSIAGIRIPDAVIDRLERAADARREGRRICVEIVQQLAEMPGLAGVHIMAFRQEDAVRGIIEDAGLRRLPATA
ncbi:MAG: methylenetetrahydrofolate reductase C-terminal domain-containing protein [Candidatus Eiseniibacteriota bacterium]